MMFFLNVNMAAAAAAADDDDDDGDVDNDGAVFQLLSDSCKDEQFSMDELLVTIARSESNIRPLPQLNTVM